MRLDSHLQSRLRDVATRRQQFRLAVRLACCWAGIGLIGLLGVLFSHLTGWNTPLALPALALLAALATFFAWRKPEAAPNWREIACLVEARYPDLEGLLLTAVQQDTQDDKSTGYLRYRLLREALYHAAINVWEDAVPRSRLAYARAARAAALLLLAVVLWGMRPIPAGTGPQPTLLGQVTVTPGDAALEKGSSLVVLARFTGPLPSTVELVASGPGETRRVPLVKSLADPVFAASLGEVSTNFAYHIEYSGERSREFQISVFEYPRLEQADADLNFPEYTGLEPKHIPNTKRISAVEGSRLDLTLRLNKPVVSASLVPKGEANAAALELLPQTNEPVALLQGHPLLENRTYELRLVDEQDRTNKVPAQFVLTALKNRTPELHITRPAGDVQPSPLEEVQFEGNVWDDFGLTSYGLGYARAGEEPLYLALGKAVPAREKTAFQHLLRLEDLGLSPDQLVCWFLWADDLGPDGQPRRSTSDLFFAEVRPFEEIYREGQGGQEQAGQQPRAGEQQRNPASRITELQKQIITATWKLKGVLHPPQPPTQDNPKSTSSLYLSPGHRRSFSRVNLAGFSPLRFAGQIAPRPKDAGSDPGRGANSPVTNSRLDDATVLLESQRQALEQARTAWQNEQDPKAAALWQSAIRQMESALAKLKEAPDNSAAYNEAMAAEQAAYQALLKLQEHQYQVSRSRRQSGQSGNSREQQRQLQLDQMELAQSENRYETRRQAQAQPNSQNREQSQVLSRLQELARRQQDLNERLKELQTALQEAKTEADREEIRRRLKRLQEEEQRMLSDVDELRQRMEQPENQSRMAEQRQQLDRTREDLQRAAQAAAQGDPSQALASGARAQEQLQQLREQMRSESAGQLGGELREMRRQAREMSREQEQLLKEMQANETTDRRSLSGNTGREELLSRLESQRSRLTNLVEQATQVSRDAEDAEPTVSRELYDSVRKLSQDTARDARDLQEELLSRGLMTRSLFERLRDESRQDGERLLDITSEMLRLDKQLQAAEAGRRTRNALDNFRRGLERAAENLLGDDTEALRQARAELDALTDQLRKERAAAEAEAAATTNRSAVAGLQGGPTGSNSVAAAAGGNRSTNNAATPGPGTNELASAGSSSPNPSQPGAPEGAGRNRQPDGQNAPRDSSARFRTGSATNGGQEGGNPGGNLDRAIDWVLNENSRVQPGPITGDEFLPWADRLRNIEDILDQPELRNEVAAARERARQMRQDFRRERKKPDWAVVRLQIINPLVEVRDQIAEELARRGSREALVPVDRDPVPGRYSDLVQRYYERLGK